MRFVIWIRTLKGGCFDRGCFQNFRLVVSVVFVVPRSAGIYSIKRVGLFYLRVSLFYLRLVFVAYGQLAWSFLLTVEIRFGLLCLRSKSVWSFLLTVPPLPEIRFGLFCLRFPPVRKLGLVFFAYGSPTVSKKDLNCK